MSRLVPVPAPVPERIWNAVAPLLEPVVIKSLGNFTLEDYRVGIDARDFQLWLSVDESGIEACAVTRIDVYPRFKTCSFVAVGGKDRENWLGFEERIAEWAKANGCTALDGFFRKGWERELKGQGWSLGWTFARKWI